MKTISGKEYSQYTHKDTYIHKIHNYKYFSDINFTIVKYPKAKLE